MLGINNRGSSGYGKTFFAADDRKHGREPLWDCVDAKKYLQSPTTSTASASASSAAATAATWCSRRWPFSRRSSRSAWISSASANWMRTLESIPPWWEAPRTALYAEIGDPAKDRKILEDISPLFHADQIRKPLMVLQGANDPRVIKRGVGRDRRRGEEERRPGRVHRVRRRGARVHEEGEPDCGYSAVLRFLDRHLKAANE